ncbi:MAG: polyprenyl synthetase family protein [Culicoidibacterales bacterium]
MELLQKIEVYLGNLYAESHILHEAMSYSLLAGGKRFRPMLVLLCGKDLGLSVENSLPIATSIEMIHTYSLIHDDLPALDNDDLRRGKPTNHRVFGEAMAILAGDGLLSDAFFEITKTETQPDKMVQMIQYLSRCVGSFGMVKGQSDDLQFEKRQEHIEKDIAYQMLQSIHANKTGKLIEACFTLPAIAAGVSEKKFKILQKVSQLLGLWFQIRDDILDVSETTEVLGKDAGSDLINEKLTYVSLFSLEGAKEKLRICEQEINRIFSEELFDMTETFTYLKEVMH